MTRPLSIPFFVFATLACAAQETKEDPRFKEARLLDSLQKHERSLKILEELAQDPVHRAEALMDAADCEFHHLGRTDEAFLHMREAIAADPDNARGYINRGTMYEHLHMADRAIEDLTIAVRLARTPDERRAAHLNLGAAYQSVRSFELALVEYDAALAEDTTNTDVLLNRSSLLDELGRSDEALATLMWLNERVPDNPHFLNNTGFLLSSMERYSEAAEWFSRALALEPDEPYSLNNRAYARLKAGDTDGALKDVERSITINPGNAYAYRNLGLIRSARGELAKACTAFEEALARGYTERFGDDVKKLHESTCH